VIVIGATNRPDDLDDAVRRRLARRIYVPLPDLATRRALLAVVLAGQPVSLTSADLDSLAARADGYSGSDIASLCKEAAMRPVRELTPEALARVDAASLRPIAAGDFAKAMAVVRPSVPHEVLARFQAWNARFGSDMGQL
jgi:spastin